MLAVLRRYLANPNFNIIASDDHGRTLYANVGSYPGAPQDLIDRCIPAGVPQVAYLTAGLVTLDGSRSSCHLRSDPAAPRPNILGPRSLPATIRRDYVENSNDSYWLANPDHPFPPYSTILGPRNNAQLFRTRLGNEMIKARLAGTDGYGPPLFDLRSLERMFGNFRAYGGELITPQLAATCEHHPTITLPDRTTVDVRAACPVLRRYQGTGRLDDPGAWLFTTWLWHIPSGFPWKDRFDPTHPLTTPRVLDDQAPDTLNALGEAVRELRANHIPLDATLRQVQYTPIGRTRLPIGGCFGCFATIQASHGPSIDFAPYGQIIYGDSLVMFTELRRSGPRAYGTLVYSQATDPTSPWHNNLTKLYARDRYVPLRYTRRSLRADRGSRILRLVVRGS
jgi:acyl-homoserine-lactone acylase